MSVGRARDDSAALGGVVNGYAPLDSGLFVPSDYFPNGTSNPGSPSDGDLFYRTDLGLMIRYYSAQTHWRCVCAHSYPLMRWTNASATDTLLNMSCIPFGQAFEIWMVQLHATMDIISGTTSSQYYTIALSKWEVITGTVIATASGINNSINQFVIETVAINSALSVTADALSAELTKVSTPGNFYGAAALDFRLIVP